MLTGVDLDHGLVTALRQREPTAAETLLTAYGDRAYRVALRITGNQHAAEEAVPDAFWSMVCKIDTFRGDAAFRSWFYRIVSNAAYEKIRRRRGPLVDISIEEVLPPFEGGCHAGLITDWSSRIEDPAVQSELRAVLSSAIAALPAHYRTVIVLRDVEGLSMAEVAEVLGISVPTAKTWAHRARLLLRKRLSMFMTSVGAAVDRPARGEYQRRSMRGGRRQYQISTIP
jgi:RNA polymerase sigma-70 factor, ECF subfamily